MNHGDNMFYANDFMAEAKLLSDIDTAIDPAGLPLVLDCLAKRPTKLSVSRRMCCQK